MKRNWEPVALGAKMYRHIVDLALYNSKTLVVAVYNLNS
jgi:hypothetical protein